MMCLCKNDHFTELFIRRCFELYAWLNLFYQCNQKIKLLSSCCRARTTARGWGALRWASAWCCTFVRRTRTCTRRCTWCLPARPASCTRWVRTPPSLSGGSWRSWVTRASYLSETSNLPVDRLVQPLLGTPTPSPCLLWTAARQAAA